MLIGHYAVSLAARTRPATPPLWVFVAAAQWFDIVWCVLVMLGVETAAANPSVAEGLTFVSYPYSHSLAAAVVWSALAWAFARRVLGASAATAGLVAAVVFSHWPLDLLVHHPDLPLWPGGPKYGLQLWDYPWLERGLEIVMFLGAAGLWALARRREARPTWPAAVFAMVGVALFSATFGATPPAPLDRVVLGLSGLSIYLGMVAVAWALDRPARRASA